jgi:uncharacterized protein YdaL
MLDNVLGHFPVEVRSKPVTSYVTGEMASTAAIFYIGSTYDEPSQYAAGSPQQQAYRAFLADAVTTTRPLVWMQYNLQHLAAAASPPGGGDGLSTRFGITFTGEDTTGGYNRVRYKGVELDKGVVRKKFPGAGIEGCAQEPDGPYDCDSALGVVRITDPSRAQAVAEASSTSTGRRSPYATRAGNLWYVGDIPFSYASESDRYLAFADLLHDVLGSGQGERHLALVRLEDVDADVDPGDLRAVVEVLERHHVPFGVAAIPFRRDPSTDPPGGPPRRVGLAGSELGGELHRLVQQGEASIVQHGTTHQWDGGPNPLSGVSGDDYEFYRVTENQDHSLNVVGPVPEDSPTWARNRIADGKAELERAGLGAFGWEAPHYLASAADYRAAAEIYPVQWGRVTYFSPGPKGDQLSSQLFPYPIHDSYGQTVLPENLGNVEPEDFNGYPATSPSDLVWRAGKALVVRDGFASFFFHPFYDPGLLDQVLTGIEKLGYRFVAPCSLADACPSSSRTQPGAETTTTTASKGRPRRPHRVETQPGRGALTW